MLKNFFSFVSCVFLLIYFSSCVTSSYYISPLYGGSTPYRTLPLHSDSIRNSLFANATITMGSANEYGHDNVYSFSGNIYNAHHFGFFNAWYGAGATLGNYRVNRFTDSFNSYSFDTSYVNKLAGNYFFGSENLGAGISFVIPFNNGGEWRILGVNASLQNEFGKYLQFRKSLNPAQVSAVVTSPVLGIISLSNELVFKTSTNSELGFLCQENILLGKNYSDIDFGTNISNPNKMGFGYFTMNTHFTYDNYSVFGTLNFGPLMTNLQVGFNYRIRKK